MHGTGMQITIVMMRAMDNDGYGCEGDNLHDSGSDRVGGDVGSCGSEDTVEESSNTSFIVCCRRVTAIRISRCCKSKCMMDLLSGETGCVHSISHRDSETGSGEHTNVVLSVTKGHDVLRLDVVFFAKVSKGGGLVDLFGDNLDDVGKCSSGLEGGIGEFRAEE